MGAHRGRPYVFVNSDPLARAIAATGAALSVLGAALWLRSVWRLADPAEPTRDGFDDAWFQMLQAIVGVVGAAAMLLMAAFLARMALGRRAWPGRIPLAAVLAVCMIVWTVLVIGMSLLN